MSYAQPSDMLARKDARRLGDLVSDTGVRVSSASLLTDPVLQAALDDAQALIDAAILRGQRYLPAELLALLPPATPTSSYQLLIRLNCDLAYGLLVGRRGYSRSDTLNQAPGYEEALGMVEALADGQRIFPDITGVPQAGVGLPAVTLSQNVALVSSLTRVFGDLTVDPSNPPSGPNQ